MSRISLISSTVSIFHININSTLPKIILVFPYFTFNYYSPNLLLILFLETTDFLWAATCPAHKDRS